jgi:hypothetical protein
VAPAATAKLVPEVRPASAAPGERVCVVLSGASEFEVPFRVALAPIALATRVTRHTDPRLVQLGRVPAPYGVNASRICPRLPADMRPGEYWVKAFARGRTARRWHDLTAWQRQFPNTRDSLVLRVGRSR